MSSRYALFTLRGGPLDGKTIRIHTGLRRPIVVQVAGHDGRGNTRQAKYRLTDGQYRFAGLE